MSVSGVLDKLPLNQAEASEILLCEPVSLSICDSPGNLGKSDSFTGQQDISSGLSRKSGCAPCFLLWEVSAAAQTTKKAAVSARAELCLVAVRFE